MGAARATSGVEAGARGGGGGAGGGAAVGMYSGLNAAAIGGISTSAASGMITNSVPASACAAIEIGRIEIRRRRRSV
jgi:hypothetical protein